MSVLLLLLHIAGLAYFCKEWIATTHRTTGGRRIFLNHAKEPHSSALLSPMYITSTLLVSNYIGICFARTLHYQFYSWYFHALPYLLWCHSTTTSSSSYPIWMRLGLLLSVEMAFLTFPAKPWSSALLQVAHLAILQQIRPPAPFVHIVGGTNTNSKQDGPAKTVRIRKEQ